MFFQSLCCSSEVSEVLAKKYHYSSRIHWETAHRDTERERYFQSLFPKLPFFMAVAVAITRLHTPSWGHEDLKLVRKAELCAFSVPGNLLSNSCGRCSANGRQNWKGPGMQWAFVICALSSYCLKIEHEQQETHDVHCAARFNFGGQGKREKKKTQTVGKRVKGHPVVINMKSPKSTTTASSAPPSSGPLHCYQTGIYEYPCVEIPIVFPSHRFWFII